MRVCVCVWILVFTQPAGAGLGRVFVLSNVSLSCHLTPPVKCTEKKFLLQFLNTLKSTNCKTKDSNLSVLSNPTYLRRRGGKRITSDRSVVETEAEKTKVSPKAVAEEKRVTKQWKTKVSHV